MAPTKVAQIVLTLNADQTLDITGPTENRLVFLGMLELARDSVNQHHHQLHQRVLVAAPADLKGKIT